jgi:hypothetical protein
LSAPAPARRPILTLPQRSILTLPSRPVAPPPATPIQPKAKKQPPAVPAKKLMTDARIAARVAALARIRELAPPVFDLDNPRPLKIGIHLDLIAQGIPAGAVRDAMAWWTGQPGYRRALAAGGPRYGLGGAEDGVVTEEQQRMELAA